MLGRRERFKFVISDCHLSAGAFFEGKLNPHEEFFFDDEMADLIEYYSSGAYGGRTEVELVIAGDFFDYLNVPYQGRFDSETTEEVALYKTEAMIRAHPKVMAALRKFASEPNKHITYLIGNHDAELFFDRVKERITREWDPAGHYPSAHVTLVSDRTYLKYPEGVEIHHGNQEEAANELDFEHPFLENSAGRKVLKLPWGSIYVLKVINRLKMERKHIDKIRPIKAFVFFGLFLDPFFTVKYLFVSSYYFLKTKIQEVLHFSGGIRKGVAQVRQELQLFQTLEEEARAILDAREEVKTVIFGHTHRPMNQIWPDGKQYINTGTWTKMINLDWSGWGQDFRRTYALIRIRDDHAECELRQWVGERGPSRVFR